MAITGRGADLNTVFTAKECKKKRQEGKERDQKAKKGIRRQIKLSERKKREQKTKKNTGGQSEGKYKKKQIAKYEVGKTPGGKGIG